MVIALNLLRRQSPFKLPFPGRQTTSYELLLEAPEEEADRAEAILVNEMEHAADLKVRLEVSAKRGYSWYDTK